jgi:hypothetical protein
VTRGEWPNLYWGEAKQLLEIEAHETRYRTLKRGWSIGMQGDLL